MATEPALILKKGRDKPVKRMHPWIFSGAVDQVVGQPEPGETVLIRDSSGKKLAQAAFSPLSQIRARIWSWDVEEQINTDFFRNKLIASLEYRKSLGLESSGVRLVHAESDGLPGIVIDQYGEYLAVQFLSAGADHWRDQIIELLEDIITPAGIYERSDVEVRELEGLKPEIRLVSGTIPDLITINEGGLKFLVSIPEGHKTGFYLDQRKNRALVQKMAAEREVLDCFCYTGGFTINSLRGGSGKVTMIDSSAEALRTAAANIDLNDMDRSKVEQIEGDVFEELRLLRDQNRKFGLIILDPPKFAPTASHAQRASRGYKDINLLAYKLLRSGGLLVSFSCSGGIKRSFFQKILSGAALDAQVNARIRMNLWQSADHPLNLRFPEGSYLKGFVTQID